MRVIASSRSEEEALARRPKRLATKIGLLVLASFTVVGVILLSKSTTDRPIGESDVGVAENGGLITHERTCSKSDDSDADSSRATDSGDLKVVDGPAPSADNRRLRLTVRTRAPQESGILGYLRVGWAKGKQFGVGDSIHAEGFVSVFGGDCEEELTLWLPETPNQLEWQFTDRKEPRFGGGPREGHQGSSVEAAGETGVRVAIPWRDRLAGVPSAGNGVWSFDPENFTGSSHVSHNVDVTLRRAYVPVRLPPSLGMPTQVFVYRQYGAHGIAFPRLELRYGDDDAYLGAVQLRARDEEELDEFGEIKRDDGSAHVRAELIRPKRPATRAEVYDVPTGGNTSLDFGRPLVWCEDGTLCLSTRRWRADSIRHWW